MLLSKLALKKMKNILSLNFIPCLHAQKVESEKGKSIFVLLSKDFLHQHQINTKKMGQKFSPNICVWKISSKNPTKFEKISIIKTFLCKMSF